MRVCKAIVALWWRSCCIIALLLGCTTGWQAGGKKCWWGSFWGGSTAPLPIYPGQRALAKNGKVTRMEGPKCTSCTSFRNHPTPEWLQPRALEIEWIFNGDFETSCPGPKVDQGPSPESYDLVTALNLRGREGEGAILWSELLLDHLLDCHTTLIRSLWSGRCVRYSKGHMCLRTHIVTVSTGLGAWDAQEFSGDI